MNSPVFEWSGSVEAPSGVATFTLGELPPVVAPMQEFKHAHALHMMLINSYKSGADAGRRAVAQSVVGSMQEHLL